MRIDLHQHIWTQPLPGSSQLVYGSDRLVIEPVRTAPDAVIGANAAALFARPSRAGGRGMSLTASELEALVAQLVDSPELWAGLVAHSTSTRICRQIWDDADVNAWLICWTEDQDTGFHDHDDSAAAIEVISGQVQEDRLRLSGPPDTRTFGPGERFSLPASAIHRVRHAGEDPAVTIHAYSPPLRRTGAYAVTSDGVLERTALDAEIELRADLMLSAT